MVDANSAYRLEDWPHLKRLEAYYLMMIEQPLGWEDLFSHAELQRRLDTPICLDECIHTEEHARAAIELGACRIINIKLGRVGDIGPANPQPCADEAAFTRLLDLVTQLDAQYSAGGNVLFYLATPPSVFGLISGNLDKAGFKKLPGWKRIIVEKPFGTDLASAPELNRADARLLGREPDLSRRSLPRQGDGAEHPRLPLLQRHVRAALEQAAHRPHPVQRLRDGRRRGPRRLLRPVRRAARHDAEPHVPDAGLPLHGAAGLVRGRRHPQREGQAAQGGARLHARGGAASTRARPVRPRQEGRRHRHARPTARSRTSTRSRTPRRSPRCGCSSTTGAGKACRSICARARRCGSAAPRSSCSSRRPPAVVFRGTPVPELAANRLIFHIQPDQGIETLLPGQDARPADAAAAGQHALQLRRGVQGVARHRLRGDALQLHDRATRRCSRAPTWSRRPGASPSRSSTPGRPAADGLPQLRGRHLGPAARPTT